MNPEHGRRNAEAAMKCLSLWQPWATLIAIGAKGLETRSWPTKYRGELLIHASKRWTLVEEAQCCQWHFRDVLVGDGAIGLPDSVHSWAILDRVRDACGHILATVRLADCFSTDDIPEKYVPLLTERERAFGNFLPGRFAWVLEDVRPLANPIPFKGRQGLFNVTASLLKTLEKSA